MWMDGYMTMDGKMYGRAVEHNASTGHITRPALLIPKQATLLACKLHSVHQAMWQLPPSRSLLLLVDKITPEPW